MAGRPAECGIDGSGSEQHCQWPAPLPTLKTHSQSTSSKSPQPTGLFGDPPQTTLSTFLIFLVRQSFITLCISPLSVQPSVLTNLIYHLYFLPPTAVQVTSSWSKTHSQPLTMSQHSQTILYDSSFSILLTGAKMLNINLCFQFLRCSLSTLPLFCLCTF